jgi:hypothetical protein
MINREPNQGVSLFTAMSQSWGKNRLGLGAIYHLGNRSRSRMLLLGIVNCVRRP